MDDGAQGGWLHSVTLEPNCMLKGLPTSSGADDQQAILLIAHLLTLLNTLVGESMTVFLLREAWPDDSFDLHIETRELS